MVFSSYSNTSYLPLDNDQGVTFYKNENLLFPPQPPTAAASATAAFVSSPSTLVCRRNTAAAAAMLTATAGSSPFGSQPLRHGPQQGTVCEDFQPVAHLSSNGYYGYVPVNSMPKMMSTDTTPPAAVAANGHGVSVLLDCHSTAASIGDSNSSSMMDCGGGIGEAENYHHLQQQQHLRKRKEYSEEIEVNCKRRKTWLEQPTHADSNQLSNWPTVQQMECTNLPMDTISAPQFNGSPITMNAPTTTTTSSSLNGFQQQISPPMPASPQYHSILQPKSKYTESSRCMMSHMI